MIHLENGSIPRSASLLSAAVRLQECVHRSRPARTTAG